MESKRKEERSVRAGGWGRERERKKKKREGERETDRLLPEGR